VFLARAGSGRRPGNKAIRTWRVVYTEPGFSEPVRWLKRMPLGGITK
jgi:hypothetical protein